MPMWKFIKWSCKHPLPLALLTILCVQLQGDTGIGFGDPDGWYHLGISQLYKSGLVTTKFAWLQDTILKDTFFDQQYLYHIVLSLHPTILWAKLVSTAVAIALFFTLSAILKTQKISNAYWWSIAGFLASSGFLFRVNLVKGSMIGVLLFFCTTLMLLKRKYWTLAPLSALWLLSHGSSVLLLPLLVSYCIVVKTGKKDVIKIFLYSALGLLIGYIAHPQHAALISYLATQLAVPLSGKNIASVGSEWYAYNFGSLIKYTSPLLFAWVSTLAWWLIEIFAELVLARNNTTPCHCEESATKQSIASICTHTRLPRSDQSIEPRNDKVTARKAQTWLWIISVGWFILFLSSKRFIEYWVPASIIPTAFTISPYLLKINVRHLVHLIKTSWQVTVGALALIACLTISVGYNTRNTVAELRNNARADIYEGASQWLAQNTPIGSIVFNTRWDHFPQLFYWNTHNYYIVGLDPLFMYKDSPSLYRKWHTITDERPEDWSTDSVYTTLKNDFHAQYILIENTRSRGLLEYIQNLAEKDTGFRSVYRDEKITVFAIQ